MAGSTLHNDFTYRGIRANGTSSLINGIPGLMTQFNAPTYAMDHIEFIDGPSGGYTGSSIQYESTAAGGMVNFVTKKAGDEPRLIYKQTFTGRSNLGEYIDVSKRFGSQKQWGVRINAENLRGETGVKGERVSPFSLCLYARTQRPGGPESERASSCELDEARVRHALPRWECRR